MKINLQSSPKKITNLTVAGFSFVSSLKFKEVCESKLPSLMTVKPDILCLFSGFLIFSARPLHGNPKFGLVSSSLLHSLWAGVFKFISI